MTRALWLLPLMCLSACALGAGSPMVGRYAAHRRVDTRTCIVGADGECKDVVETGVDEPDRTFAGGIVSLPVGYTAVSAPGEHRSLGTVEADYEYIRGRGRYAISARIGVAESRSLSAPYAPGTTILQTPVSVLGHVGSQRASLFGGFGYAPFARYEHDGMSSYVHSDVFASLGARLVLHESVGVYMTFSPELRLENFGDATLARALGVLGLYF